MTYTLMGVLSKGALAEVSTNANIEMTCDTLDKGPRSVILNAEGTMFMGLVRPEIAAGLEEIKGGRYYALMFEGFVPIRIFDSRCYVCGVENSRLKCSECKYIYYCGDYCQRKDWSQGKHKIHCQTKWKAAKAAMGGHIKEDVRGRPELCIHDPYYFAPEGGVEEILRDGLPPTCNE